MLESWATIERGEESIIFAQAQARESGEGGVFFNHTDTT